jgi:drug/metabolite transporter (DMT)-like permease
MGYMTLGAVTGPFLGVSLLNMSIQRIPTGVAQTMAALVPVLIIPFVVFLKKERISWRAVIGAFVAVAGVAILMLAG